MSSFRSLSCLLILDCNRTTAIQLPTIPKNIRQHKLVKQKLVWDQIDNEKYNENITANLKDIDDFQKYDVWRYFWMMS
jgi:hypothetical protein